MPSFHMGRMLLVFGFSMLLLGLAKPATPCLPPDPDLYAILLSEADGAITAARAKIKATGSEHLGAGELRAQLRYQLHPPAEHKKFHYAVSTSVRVDGLSNDTATQVEFDFSQALIPGGAFHLTLKIFYQEDGAEVPLLISEYRPKQLRKEMSEILVPDLPPLQGSVIVWGPATFFRELGKPKTERVSIPISDPTGSFLLRLANGAADGEKRVSSANIRLNGRDVFKPCEFNQRARELSRQVTLLAGENLLEVKLKSAPGAQVTLELFRLEKSGCSALEVHTFMRNYGKPVVKEEIFELSPEITGPFTLNLFNGDPDGERRVDSAVISLNGQRVFSPRDFNERTGILSQIVSLKEKNTLRVELRGAPGDFLSLGITGYDHTPPKVEITGPGEGAIFTASPITVTGTVNDLLALVKVNGIVVPVSADGTFVLEGVALQEGENQIRVVAVDPCGNEGQDQISVSLRNSLEGPPLRFCTQLSMPTIARAMEAEEEECRTQAYTWGTGRVRGTTDPTAVLTINGVLLSDRVEVSDQGEIAYAFRDGGSFSASLKIPEKDGVYPFTAVAMNAAGGRTEATVTFVRDTTAPNVVITSPPDGWVTKTPTVTVTGTVDDPQATVWWYYDAPPIPLINGSFIVEIPLYEGENGIGISAYDEIWNQGFASIRVFWDTIPPQINIANLAEGAAVNNAILTVTGRVVDETPDTVTVMVNGETPQSLTLNDSDFGGTLVLSPGPNSLVFTATDRAGNISQVVRSIVLDTEPPTVAITSPASGAHVSGTLSVTIDAGDLGAGIASVALFVDGKTAGTLTQPPFTFSVNTALLAMGSHTITAVGLDKAGNQSEATITVSLSRFMIEIVSPADSAIINKTQTMVREGSMIKQGRSGWWSMGF